MSNYKLLIRASSGKAFCTKGKSKDAEFGDVAIGLIQSIAIDNYFGIKEQISSKEMDKGIIMESEAIEMVNRLEFKQYVKNIVRINDKGFTGECDIDDKEGNLIRDIKNAWSPKTFSWTSDMLADKVKKSGHDIQLRIYMMLFDRDYACVDEVLLSTPIDLIPMYDDPDYHDVDRIPEHKRHTKFELERDKLWEEWLLERYEKAEKIYNEFINQLEAK
jgi:hypothetical protein